MISKHSLTQEWLTEKRKLYKSDPSIMERVIYALKLLEELVQTDLQFIFKGGTSLLLLMDEPSRFSIDIDIIISDKIAREELEKELNKIVGNGIFKRIELDERRSYRGNIPKAHYRFFYDSNETKKEQEILLDVLFEESTYPQVIERHITCEWLHHEGDPLIVTTPDLHSITGDKLTAFAPKTIGIPYGREKEKEIIKQLYDVGMLFNLVTDIAKVKASFIPIAEKEILYRAEASMVLTNVLDDIFETGILLARRDSQLDPVSKSYMKELQTGINQFGHFIYRGAFRIEDAQLASAKAAYLAAMIKVDYNGEIKKYDTNASVQLIQHKEFQFLNKKLKFVSGGALFYWNETLNLLYPNPNN